jgi:hypothetical protein
VAKVIERIQETRYDHDYDVDLADARAGTSVEVRSDYRKPRRRGAAGTIKKRYGTRDYTVFAVSFPDGQTELFWDHQLEVAKEGPIRRPRRWWPFW